MANTLPAELLHTLQGIAESGFRQLDEASLAPIKELPITIGYATDSIKSAKAMARMRDAVQGQRNSFTNCFAEVATSVGEYIKEAERLSEKRAARVAEEGFDNLKAYKKMAQAALELEREKHVDGGGAVIEPDPMAVSRRPKMMGKARAIQTDESVKVLEQEEYDALQRSLNYARTNAKSSAEPPSLNPFEFPPAISYKQSGDVLQLVIGYLAELATESCLLCTHFQATLPSRVQTLPRLMKIIKELQMSLKAKKGAARGSSSHNDGCDETKELNKGSESPGAKKKKKKSSAFTTDQWLEDAEDQKGRAQAIRSDGSVATKARSAAMKEAQQLLQGFSSSHEYAAFGDAMESFQQEVSEGIIGGAAVDGDALVASQSNQDSVAPDNLTSPLTADLMEETPEKASSGSRQQRSSNKKDVRVVEGSKTRDQKKGTNKSKYSSPSLPSPSHSLTSPTTAGKTPLLSPSLSKTGLHHHSSSRGAAPTSSPLPSSITKKRSWAIESPEGTYDKEQYNATEEQRRVDRATAGQVGVWKEDGDSMLLNPSHIVFNPRSLPQTSVTPSPATSHHPSTILEGVGSPHSVGGLQRQPSSIQGSLFSPTASNSYGVAGSSPSSHVYSPLDPPPPRSGSASSVTSGASTAIGGDSLNTTTGQGLHLHSSAVTLQHTLSSPHSSKKNSVSPPIATATVPFPSISNDDHPPQQQPQLLSVRPAQRQQGAERRGPGGGTPVIKDQHSTPRTATAAGTTSSSRQMRTTGTSSHAEHRNPMLFGEYSPNRTTSPHDGSLEPASSSSRGRVGATRAGVSGGEIGNTVVELRNPMSFGEYTPPRTSPSDRPLEPTTRFSNSKPLPVTVGFMSGTPRSTSPRAEEVLALEVTVAATKAKAKAKAAAYPLEANRALMGSLAVIQKEVDLLQEAVPQLRTTTSSSPPSQQHSGNISSPSYPHPALRHLDLPRTDPLKMTALTQLDLFTQVVTQLRMMVCDDPTVLEEQRRNNRTRGLVLVDQSTVDADVDIVKDLRVVNFQRRLKAEVLIERKKKQQEARSITHHWGEDTLPSLARSYSPPPPQQQSMKESGGTMASTAQLPGIGSSGGEGTMTSMTSTLPQQQDPHIHQLSSPPTTAPDAYLQRQRLSPAKQLTPQPDKGGTNWFDSYAAIVVAKTPEPNVQYEVMEGQRTVMQPVQGRRGQKPVVKGKRISQLYQSKSVRKL